KTLLAFGSPLQVTHITSPIANLNLAESILLAAQATPQGRARLALVSALGNTPGWFDAASAEPAENDLASQSANQFTWASHVAFPFAFALRAELEFRAGGNPPWNTAFTYPVQSDHSPNP